MSGTSARILTHPHHGQNFPGLLPSGVDLQHLDLAERHAALLIADRILHDEDLRSGQPGAHTKAGYVVVEDDDFGFRWHRRNGADDIEGELHEPNAVLARSRVAIPGCRRQSCTFRTDPMHTK